MNLEWTPYLAVGVSAIDNQHKELFSRFNNLMDAMTLGNGKEELTNTLVFLEDYVVTHFGTEEKLMDEYFYAAAPGHKAQHATFGEDFAALKKRLEASGANAQLAIETLRRLGDWLMNHVGRVDKQLGPFLNAAMIARKAA